MTTCDKCGHDGAGLFCGQCGADLAASDVPTSATRQADAWRSGEHREGWQDQATSAGFPSYQSQGSYNPSQAPYRGTDAPNEREGNDGRRSNQLLATLVGVAAVVVCALVAYLFLKPGHSGSTNAGPSVSPTSSAPSSSASSRATTESPSPTSTTEGVAPVPPPATVTKTAEPTSGGGGSDNNDSNSGNDISSLGAQTTITQDGINYAAVQDGRQLTIYADDGGVHPLTTISLQGGGHNVSFASLSGCSKPIVLFNAGGASGSAGYGWDGSNYSAYQASGNDLIPAAGTGGGLPPTYGVDVYNGNVEFRNKDNKIRGHGDMFDSCSSASPDILHWASRG